MFNVEYKGVSYEISPTITYCEIIADGIVVAYGYGKTFTGSFSQALFSLGIPEQDHPIFFDIALGQDFSKFI